MTSLFTDHDRGATISDDGAYRLPAPWEMP